MTPYIVTNLTLNLNVIQNANSDYARAPKSLGSSTAWLGTVYPIKAALLHICSSAHQVVAICTGSRTQMMKDN